MKPIALLFLCFSLCLSFLPSLINGESNLVAQACEKAKYKDICISSLEAEHATKDAGDLATIALIAVKVATNNGSSTANYIKKILDNPKVTEPAVQETFDDCSDHYISAMQQLDDALEALVSKDYKDAKVWLGAAVTDASSCESDLNAGAGDDAELNNKNSVFLKLCTNALDILNLLASNATASTPSN
ncbi:Pectinesterase inhibitor [Corchorus capsularis]|uniref:Pectinesterase inhibitor n=1 Tax=Corchorus capsularis TaxID=210143 RepID=A0A1R3H0I5_COCAP|nr:Pectinesterase inhibitor [Corchorus capsularis]